ncbi:MAG TPA: AraC family transcriptional regulator [Flavobacterium sp.]|nr:AraC family transcriptional regulator [Flavobacterium sp.]
MPKPIPKKILARQHEITADFLAMIDNHLDDIVEGRILDMFEIRDFAERLHIHPTHLSNTIKLTTGKAPCYFFEDKLMAISKSMLEEGKMSIAQIAILLTYDPSNFTKFFKHFSGQTPKQYREAFLLSKVGKSEVVTI